MLTHLLHLLRDMPAVAGPSVQQGTSTEVFADPLVGAGLAALLGAIVCAAVAHGILRPLLEARGVVPWTVRDSLGSLPLVLVGSALSVGAAFYLVLQRLAPSVASHAAVLPSVAAGVLLLVGLSTLRLGLLALRKLT